MLVLSHRGLHHRFPENTLEAFAAAASIGVDGIETDLRVTSANEIVLHHDRNTPDGAPVSSMSRAELSARVGHTVPTLQEALAEHPDLLWNLEIKDFQQIDIILGAIRELAGRHRIVVTSFWHPAALRCSEIDGVEVGVLVSHRPTDSRAFAKSLADTRSIRWVVWNYEWIDRSLLTEVAELGLRSMVYGVQTPVEHDDLLPLAVVGVITDTPECVLKNAERVLPTRTLST